LYELYAVANHHGDVFGGHLMATCKSPLDNKWRHFDDSRVTEVEEDDENVQSKNAIVLCYRRKTK